MRLYYNGGAMYSSRGYDSYWERYVYWHYVRPATSRERFKYMKSNRKSARQLNLWENKYGDKIPIADMTVQQLETAIDAVSRGYWCFGQRSKIISLEKELERRRNV